jgi:hypothetical protein
MANKHHFPKSTLSIDDAPVTKKPSIEKPSKLGLINKSKTKMCAFRLRVETIDALLEFAKKINKKSKIKLSKTQVLELIILEGIKNPNKINELYQ